MQSEFEKKKKKKKDWFCNQNPAQKKKKIGL